MNLFIFFSYLLSIINNSELNAAGNHNALYVVLVKLISATLEFEYPHNNAIYVSKFPQNRIDRRDR